MRKVLLLTVVLLSFIGASAQKSLGYFNTFGVGLNVGTEGIGMNVAAPLGNHFDVSAGFDVMPAIKFNANVKVNTSGINLPYPDGTPFNIKDVDVQGNVKRVTGFVKFDYYPFNHSSFFIAAGFSYGGSRLLKLKGHSNDIRDYYQAWLDEGKTFDDVKINLDLEDFNLPVNQNGDVDGYAKINGFRPYFGLGFGRLVPKKRVGVRVELGAQLHGTPKLYYKEENGSYQELQKLDKVKGDDDLSKYINKMKVYPVLKLSFVGRIL